MNPSQFLYEIIDPSLDWLAAFGPHVTDEARQMLLAIALQEAGRPLQARYQNYPSVQPGPARGFWQFESGGGCLGVLNHRVSSQLANETCQRLSVLPEPRAVWRAIEGHDRLACVFARLLLFTDPAPLPKRDQEEESWSYYMRLWRPGKPHRGMWPQNWDTAQMFVHPPPEV